MNKNTRLIVSVLFIFIIVLAVAITRFYSGSEKIAYNDASQPDVEDVVEYDPETGNCIFRTGDDLFGIKDANNRVIVSPEWSDLRFTKSGFCIASKHLSNNKDLYGCIDYEGNITIPFVYSDIREEKFYIYSKDKTDPQPSRYLFIAKTNNDNDYVVYDSSFKPCFSQAWKKYKTDGATLDLYTNKGEYSYIVSASDIKFDSASVENMIFNKSIQYRVNVVNGKNDLLSDFSVSMMEKMTKDLGKYIEYAFKYRDNSTEAMDCLAAMKCNTEGAELTPIFPEEKGLKVSLKKLSNINVNRVRYGEPKPMYRISFSAYIDIFYKVDGFNKKYNNDGELLYDGHLTFEGTSALDLRIVEGKFEKEKLD